LRITFYKSVATFVRAFADIAQDLTEAGYSDADAAALQKEVEFYGDIRAAIKKHSGEELDIKPFEADMRRLLNTYVQADPAPEMSVNLNSLSLTELIIETGIHDAIARKLNEKGKLSKNAIAEGIINNIRKTIIRDQLTDPRFYSQMSKLLDDLIKQSRLDAAAYEAFLKKAEDLVNSNGRKRMSSPVCLPSCMEISPLQCSSTICLAFLLRRRAWCAKRIRWRSKNGRRWHSGSIKPCGRVHQRAGEAMTPVKSKY
jgi:type I restriction enzyme R subunit